jgi:hypothetical protein
MENFLSFNCVDVLYNSETNFQKIIVGGSLNEGPFSVEGPQIYTSQKPFIMEIGNNGIAKDAIEYQNLDSLRVIDILAQGEKMLIYVFLQEPWALVIHNYYLRKLKLAKIYTLP